MFYHEGHRAHREIFLSGNVAISAVCVVKDQQSFHRRGAEAGSPPRSLPPDAQPTRPPLQLRPL